MSSEHETSKFSQIDSQTGIHEDKIVIAHDIDEFEGLDIARGLISGRRKDLTHQEKEDLALSLADAVFVLENNQAENARRFSRKTLGLKEITS